MGHRTLEHYNIKAIEHKTENKRKLEYRRLENRILQLRTLEY